MRWSQGSRRVRGCVTAGPESHSSSRHCAGGRRGRLCPAHGRGVPESGPHRVENGQGRAACSVLETQKLLFKDLILPPFEQPCSPPPSPQRPHEETPSQWRAHVCTLSRAGAAPEQLGTLATGPVGSPSSRRALCLCSLSREKGQAALHPGTPHPASHGHRCFVHTATAKRLQLKRPRKLLLKHTPRRA